MITLLRVLFGFIIACLVAGAVTVAFVVTPADIAACRARRSPSGSPTPACWRCLPPPIRRFSLFRSPCWPTASARCGTSLLALLCGRRPVDRRRRLRRLLRQRGGWPAVHLQQLRPRVLSDDRHACRSRLLARCRTPCRRQARRCASAGRSSAAERRENRPRRPREAESPSDSHAQLSCCIAAIRLRFPQCLRGQGEGAPHARPRASETLRPPLHRCRVRLFGREHCRLCGLRRSGAELLVGRAAAGRASRSRRRNCGTGRCPWRRRRAASDARSIRSRGAPAPPAASPPRALPTNPFEAMSAFANAMSGAPPAMSAMPMQPLADAANPMAAWLTMLPVRVADGRMADGLRDDVVGRAARRRLADGRGQRGRARRGRCGDALDQEGVRQLPGRRRPCGMAATPGRPSTC